MALLSGFDELNSANATFSDWLTKTNELILLMRGANTAPSITSVMTANSLPGGSMTFGNATLFGQFTSNTMVVLNDGGNDGSDDSVFANGDFGGLRGGTWDNVSNTISRDTLYVVSNTTFTDESEVVYVDSTYGLIVEQNIEARHDVLFVGNGGSNTNPKMHWEDADNILSWNNDVRAIFGKDSGSEAAGGTLQYEMFYSGGRMYSNTDVQDVRATANLNLITDVYELRSESNNELMMTANVADGVELYWDGNLRMGTNTHGIVVYGDTIVQDNVVVFDNNKILMGGAYPYNGAEDIATYNFQIYTDGTDGIIVSGDKDLNIFVHEGFNLTNEPGTVNFITANNDGSSEVVLYNNGDARLETTGSQVGEVPGVEIFGEANTTTLRVRQDANFDNETLNSNSVHWDASLEIWNYRDLVRVTLGDSDDWESFYDGVGSRAYSNTDNMDIRARTDMNMITDIFELKSETGAELYMSADVADNSTVRLYYEGVERLQTNTHGVEVTGELVANGGIVTYNNQPIEMGGANYAAAHNFTIVTDGTDSFITETTNDLFVRVQDNFRVTDDTGATSLIVANTSGEVTLYHNNNQKMQTNAYGIEVTGEANTDTLRVNGNVHIDGSTDGLSPTLNANNVQWVSLSNTMNFDDNTYLEFGNSGDFKIHHDGSHTYMQDTAGVGNVYLDTNTFIVRNAAGNENLIRALQDTSVALYYNNTIRLETTNIGVDIEGEANTDTLRVQGDAAFESDSVSANEVALEWNSGSRVLDWNDDARARFGNGVDLQIWHSSSDNNSYIAESGTGNLNISGTNINIEAQDGTNYITAVDGSSVTLFYAGAGANNVARVTTTNIGVDLEGEANTDTLRVQGDVQFENGAGVDEVTWDASASVLDVVDDVRMRFGNSQDLQIWHDPATSTSYIREESVGGALIIEGTNMNLRATDGSRYLVGNDGTSVQIYSPDDTVALTANNNQVHITDLANTNTLRVRGTSLFENDISIEGSTSAVTLSWDKSANTLNFDDNNYATFGTGGDLTITHDGADATIWEQTGSINIYTSANNEDIALRSDDSAGGVTDYLRADGSEGKLRLYYYGAQKLETNVGGITVTGNTVADGFVAGDNEKLQLGDSQDLELYHNATNSVVENNTGALVIQNNANDNDVVIKSDDSAGGLADYIRADGSTGDVILSHYGTEKLYTKALGVDIIGQANTISLRSQGTALLEQSVFFDGVDPANTAAAVADQLVWEHDNNILQWKDDVKATFGTSDDLQIYHDGNNSFIREQGTGQLNVDASVVSIRDITDGHAIATFTDGAGVVLRHNNVTTFETSATGATLTGTLIADGVTVGDSEIIQLGTTMQLYNDGSASYINETGSDSLFIQSNNLIIEDTGGGNYVTGVAGGTVRLYHAGAYKLETDAQGVNVNGDLDVSTALTVGGATNLESNINIQGSTGADTVTWTKSSNTLNFDDNNFATFGTSGDLEIYHDGSHSYIRDQGTGRLYATSSNFRVTNAQGDETMIDAVEDGAVSLWYNGVSKFTTSNTGATVTGTLVADGVTVGDDEIIQLGTTMQLYNDGSISYIKETGTGSLVAQANDVIIEATSGENMIQGVAGGAVTLYHNGASKLATATDGIDITGSLDVSTNLTVTGTTALNGTVDLGNATGDNIDFNGRVRTNIIPNANNSRDLGSATLVWNDIYSGGTVFGAAGSFTGDMTISGNTSVTGNTSASHFIGNGSQLTNLNGSNIATGTVAADRIAAELTSNTSGIAAKSDDIAVAANATDAAFPIVFTDATGSYRNAYDDASFTYNPSDDELIVPNLTVNTNITLPTTVEIATGNFTDISVSNTATILNLEVTSLEANGVAFTGTGGDVTTTAATFIDSFPIGQTAGFKYFVHGEVLNDSTKGYAVEINVIVTNTDGDGANTDIYYTRYGEVENGMSTVEIVPQLSSSNTTHIDLMATCPAATATAIHRFNVLKIETRDNGI